MYMGEKYNICHWTSASVVPNKMGVKVKWSEVRGNCALVQYLWTCFNRHTVIASVCLTANRGLLSSQAPVFLKEEWATAYEINEVSLRSPEVQRTVLACGQYEHNARHHSVYSQSPSHSSYTLKPQRLIDVTLHDFLLSDNKYVTADSSSPIFFFLFPRVRSWNYSRETVTLASLRLPGVSRPVALQPHRDGKITAESPGSVKNIFWYISKFNNEVFACMRQTGYNVLLLNFRCVIQIPFPPVSSCCAKINKLRLCLHSYCKYVRMVWYLTSNMFEWVIHLC